MTYFRSDGWVKNVMGQAIAGAQIYICTEPADVSFLPPIPLAQIYADPAGATSIVQPIITDGFGHYSYYAASGIPYTEVVVNGGKVQQVYQDQVPMGATLGTSTSPVTSVFSRAGDILAQAGDYSAFYDPLGAAAAAQAASDPLGSAAAAVVGLAPLASPHFSGTIQIVNAYITGTLKDGTGSVGTPGYLLSSTGTSTAWVPPSGPPIAAISIADSAIPGTANLTTEGTYDWWQAAGNITNYTDALGQGSRKALGGRQISDLWFIGAGGAFGNFTYGTTFSWTGNDSENGSTTNSSGIYTSGANNGFRFRVPADTFNRVLRIYSGVTSGIATVTCHLSDGALGNVTHNTSSGNSSNLFTINYNAAHDGQYMVVTIVLTTDNGGGNCFIAGVSLAAV